MYKGETSFDVEAGEYLFKEVAFTIQTEDEAATT